MTFIETSSEHARTRNPIRAQRADGPRVQRPFARSLAPSLREIVKARAAAASMSLNEVERRARWSTGTLSRVLRANMTLASLERIATALGCPAWELLRDAVGSTPTPDRGS